MNDLIVCLQAMSASARRRVAACESWHGATGTVMAGRVVVDGVKAVGGDVRTMPDDVLAELHATACRMISAHYAERREALRLARENGAMTW